MSTANNNDYPNAQLLVDVRWVEDHLASSEVVLLDARAQGYDAGHIPGAIWLNAKHLKDTSNHTFVSAEGFREVLERSGVSDGKTIVVYDDGSGVLATRVFYVLEYYGHIDRVKLLNGGYTAWTAAAKEISAEAPRVQIGTIAAVSDERRVITKEDIQAGGHNRILLDVRSADEFSGSDQRTNRKGGHIKGALHKEWKDALGPADELGVVRFKDFPTLKQEFETLGLSPDQTIVPYCQTNQRGAHTYFILRLLGYSDIRPYEGSWDEWGNAEDTEVVR
ncbi:sulfurtransferase [Paenibacillus sp. SYP-B3998]|uniref:thiosulfate sulfurtransferase n=1 Tax=Paenibacillus sp. SYP-B3998 TaxID=2678564 RepID=A0A6G3ZRV2_9BACL|nr:sulfurtransferase [Paenibacillus sp. SYP-B3998]NEW04936.1 sulfurtransferase [Paenibacillus sp. SYP-B3998]